MKTDFTVKKAAFVNSLRAKVYDRNPDKLPAVLIGSKIPWLGIHMRGGTISGRMLIPLTEEGRRIGRRAFKRVIDTLIRSGNAYFIRKNGQAILMAENIKDTSPGQARPPVIPFRHDCPPGNTSCVRRRCAGSASSFCMP